MIHKMFDLRQIDFTVDVARAANKHHVVTGNPK